MNKVKPNCLWANGLWNQFTGRKRYDITCGDCNHTYKDKVPFRIDTASSVCPCCGAQNTWSHSNFERSYNKQRSLMK